MYLADTASYILDGRMWLAGAKLVAHQCGLYQSESPQQILNYLALHTSFQTYCSYSGKPMNAVLRAVAMAISGDTANTSDWAMALVGIATLPVFFFFVRRLFQDVKIALIATALLSISQIHVQYSRGEKSEVDSGLFLLLALWCYYEAAMQPTQAARWTWGSGLLVGLAFTSNNRFVFAPPMFFLIAAAEAYLLRHSVRQVAGNFARVLAGFIVMLVLWELPYHWALLAAKHAGIIIQPFWTFWESIGVRFVIGGGGWQLESLPSLVWVIGSTDGLIPVLGLVGLVIATRSWRRFEVALIAIVVGTGLVFFWWMRVKALVCCAFILPMLCLLAGITLQTIMQHKIWRNRQTARTITLSLLVTGTLSWPLLSSWRTTQLSWRVPEAAVWLRQHRPNERVLTTCYPQLILEYDTAHTFQLPVPVSLDFLKAARKAGFTLLMTDPQKFNAALAIANDIDERLLPSAAAFATPLIAAIEASVEPVATFTNQYSDLYFLIFAREQNNDSLARTLLFLHSVDPSVDSVIRIYDLDIVLHSLDVIRTH